MFVLQVKNKPYQLGEEYAFVLKNGAVANRNVPDIENLHDDPQKKPSFDIQENLQEGKNLFTRNDLYCNVFE